MVSVDLPGLCYLWKSIESIFEVGTPIGQVPPSIVGVKHAWFYTSTPPYMLKDIVLKKVQWQLCVFFHLKHFVIKVHKILKESQKNLCQLYCGQETPYAAVRTVAVLAGAGSGDTARFFLPREAICKRQDLWCIHLKSRRDHGTSCVWRLQGHSYWQNPYPDKLFHRRTRSKFLLLPSPLQLLLFSHFFHRLPILICSIHVQLDICGTVHHHSINKNNQRDAACSLCLYYVLW